MYSGITSGRVLNGESTNQHPQTITTKTTNRKTKEKETSHGSIRHTANT